MSPGFWLGTASVFIGSLAAGAGLGGYATGAFGRGLWSAAGEYRSLAEQVGNPDAAYGPSTASYGWGEPGSQEPIVCKGCGPTLADRRMAEQMIALETDFSGRYALGYDDPVVRDYYREEKLEPLVPEEVPAPRKRMMQVASVETPVPAPQAVVPLGVVQLAAMTPVQQ